MKIPRKNIFKKMMDIRRPEVLKAEDAPAAAGGKLAREKKISAILARADKIRPARRFPWKTTLVCFLALAVFGGGFVFFSIYESKRALLKKAEKNLNDSGLSAHLDLPSGQLEINSFGDLQTKVWPLLKNGFGAYQGLSELTGAWLKLTGDANNLVFALFSGTEGKTKGLLAALKNLQGDIHTANQAADRLDASGLGLGGALPIPPDQYLSIKYEINFWDQTLTSLIGWLAEDRKVIVFLQNSSEMRPTGGFWGSFAEINFTNGEVSSAAIRDINEIDRTLESRTVPPKPLQALVANWRTADSNWFFDFKQSAAKARDFMDSSRLYAENGNRVAAVLAVSPKVISDLLALTGPVSVSSTRAQIGADNFLPAIQEEVQAGHDIGSRNAKQVLKDIFPLLLQKLSAADAAKKEKLLENLLSWTKFKDLVFWVDDASLESLLEDRGVAGSVFEIPRRWNGDYLAVAGANIGGGKSDYVMKQTVNLESQLNLNGTVTDHLEILRENLAEKTDSWWYKIANQSYFRVFLPEAINLRNAKGGMLKTIYPPVNYARLGYEIDPSVAETESTAENVPGFSWLKKYKESGKTVFAAWLKTKPGGKNKLTLDYSRRLFLFPAAGVSYQFVFDKQPGINGEYSFAFFAPAGLVWRENNSPLYEYKAADIPGRLILDLTLKKID